MKKKAYIVDCPDGSLRVFDDVSSAAIEGGRLGYQMVRRVYRVLHKKREVLCYVNENGLYFEPLDGSDAIWIKGVKFYEDVTREYYVEKQGEI